MSTREHLSSVVASVRPVMHGVADEKLGAPSPCPDFDVRAVVNHMLGTIDAMGRIGASRPLDPDDPWGTSGEHVGDKWREDLAQRLETWVEAWRAADAWEGDAMGGAMTKQMIGDMAYVEVLLHGWDLARGAGLVVEYDARAVDRALEIMDEIGEMGRSQGAFGPEIRVPEDASTLAKVLAKAGRDPEWTAP